jgi:pimeloyl-ACP methyl ester carboxylesterase
MRTFVFLLVSLIASVAHATEGIVQLNTRGDVRVAIYYIKRENATATAVLLPGGAGGFGKLVDGKPSALNFLVRSRDLFADAGLNVAVVNRASDMEDLDYPDRIAPDHINDLRKVVDYLKADTGLPVWLVGTSRGTVSATAAAIAFGNERLAGLVLTSSVVNVKKVGAVPSQKLSAIRIPVLVVHNERDACVVCRPRDVPAIMRGLTNAPVKKLVMVDGGQNPTGDPCGSQHYHGYIGMEKTAVDLVTNWIKHPTQ